MFDSNIFTRCSPFWFLNPLKHFFVQFCSRLLASNTCIHGPINVYYYLQGRTVGEGGAMGAVDPPPLSKKVPFFKKKPKWYYFVYFLFKNIACFYLPWFYLLGLISREIVSYTQIRCKFELWDNGLLIRNCAYTRDCSHITSSIILWFMTTPFPCNQP